MNQATCNPCPAGWNTNFQVQDYDGLTGNSTVKKNKLERPSRARPCNCAAQRSTNELSIRLDGKLVAKCKFSFVSRKLVVRERMAIFTMENLRSLIFNWRSCREVDKPCAGVLLVSDCRSSSSVAEYLILYVLLMVEARFRSDSNWELSWRPEKQNRDQTPVVRRVDSTMHWINHFSLDNSTGFGSSNPMDSDLSTGWHHPTFQQLGPGEK